MEMVQHFREVIEDNDGVLTIICIIYLSIHLTSLDTNQRQNNRDRSHSYRASASLDNVVQARTPSNVKTLVSEFAVFWSFKEICVQHSNSKLVFFENH